MIKPHKYLNRIILFLIGITIVCAVLFPKMQDAFATNIVLNGLIAAVLLVGIVISMRQTYMLIPALHWLEKFKKNNSTENGTKVPELLGTMATMMEEQKNRKLSLSTASMSTLLDGIASRMDEGREVTRYIIGLLIFLGLLGTFWGLLTTIGSIGNTIDSLQVGSGDVGLMFDDLKEGLAAPLSGMGTAFSSSLFGLAGSLVLGFIDLQSGQAQGRFFNHLEDWLSGITKLSSARSSLNIDASEASVPSYVSALLEQSADSLESLHKVILRSEVNKSEINHAITNLSTQLSALVDHQAEMHSGMIQMVSALGANKNEDVNHSAKHLRNIDIQLKALTVETIKGQDKFTASLHSEIRLLARTLGAVVDSATNTKEKTSVKSREPVQNSSLRASTQSVINEKVDTKTNKKTALTAKRDG